MIFEPVAEVYDIWAHHGDCKKAKAQTVRGRDFHSLSLRLEGEVRFTVNGESFLSGKNCVTFMPANTDYVTEVIEDSRLLVVHFKTHRHYENLTPFSFNVSNDTELLPIFTELCDSYRAEGSYKCISLFYSILNIIDSPRRFVPRRMRLAKEFIDTRFAEHISVQSLAYSSGLSEVHFRSEFKKHFGYSPLAYIKKVRIDNAKQLLRSGYYSVTETASACGYDSVSYFSQEFKREVGMTPTEYVIEQR